MSLEVVLTQTLAGGHTLVYLRNTEAAEPPAQLAEHASELVARIEAADPSEVSTADLVAVNHALHAHRAKVVREIAAKEQHHEALVSAVAKLPSVQKSATAKAVLAELKENPTLEGRNALLRAQIEQQREEHAALTARLEEAQRDERVVGAAKRLLVAEVKADAGA